MQVEQGNAEVQQASRASKLAVLKEAEVVVSTLGAAGGDLLTLSAGQLGFDAVIIDEVHPISHPHNLGSSQQCKNYYGASCM